MTGLPRNPLVALPRHGTYLARASTGWFPRWGILSGAHERRHRFWPALSRMALPRKVSGTGCGYDYGPPIPRAPASLSPRGSHRRHGLRPSTGRGRPGLSRVPRDEASWPSRTPHECRPAARCGGPGTPRRPYHLCDLPSASRRGDGRNLEPGLFPAPSSAGVVRSLPSRPQRHMGSSPCPLCGHDSRRHSPGGTAFHTWSESRSTLPRMPHLPRRRNRSGSGLPYGRAWNRDRSLPPHWRASAGESSGLPAYGLPHDAGAADSPLRRAGGLRLLPPPLWSRRAASDFSRPWPGPLPELPHALAGARGSIPLRPGVATRPEWGQRHPSDDPRDGRRSTMTHRRISYSAYRGPESDSC